MRWVLLLVFVTLPIQWVLLPTHVIGQQRLSVLVSLVAVAVAAAICSHAAYRRYLTLTWPFVVGMLAIAVLWLGANLFHGESLRDPVQQVVQIAIFVFVGTSLAVTLRRPSGVALMRWAGPACNLVLLVALVASMLVNHINPIEVITRTVSTGDPAYLENRLFKAALVGFGFEADDLQSNVRHEIFGAVLTAACLSSVACQLRPFRSRAAVFVSRFSLGLSFVLILISLSRSVTIAALIWPVLSLSRSWRTRHFTPGQVAATLIAGILVAVSAAAGFSTVILDRFTSDTSSYDKRGSLLDNAFANIQSHPLVGGVSTQSASSHNFVLDTWLRIGIVGAFIALLIVVVVAVLMGTLVARAPHEPAWMVPVATLLGLALVRLFTAGGGDLPPVGWVTLAVAAACLCQRGQSPEAYLVRRTRRRSVRGAPPSPIVSQPTT